MDSELVERIADLARSKKIQIAMSEWNINEAIWTAEKKVLKGKISSKEAFRVINLMADAIRDGISDGTIVWLGFPSEAVVNSRVVIEELMLMRQTPYISTLHEHPIAAILSRLTKTLFCN